MSGTNPADVAVRAPTTQLQPHSSDPAWGTFYGIVAALGYTGANVALRQLADRDDPDWAVWVSCIKAVPATIIVWLLVGYRAAQGLPALPPRRLVWPLIATGLFMQFGGNVLFQWALSLGGLALTVPLNFAALLLSAAWGGRLYLGEGITPRSAAAMGLLLLSIISLCFGADEATASMLSNVSPLKVSGAVVAAGIAGVAYGVSGVVIRGVVTRDVSMSATLVYLSTTGVVGLGLVSLFRIGPDRLLATSPREWQWMLAAGSMNAVAFFAVTASLKRIPVNRVNLLNASQVAILAIIGVLFFGEALTGWLVLGTLLTVLGLGLMENRRGAANVAASVTNDA